MAMTAELIELKKELANLYYEGMSELSVSECACYMGVKDEEVEEALEQDTIMELVDIQFEKFWEAHSTEDIQNLFNQMNDVE